MYTPPLPHCAACPFPSEERACILPGGKHRADCPTVCQPELVAQSRALYAQADEHRMGRESAIVEREGYARLPQGGLMPQRPRIMEIVAFAQRMGYERLGLIFCIALRTEAAATAKLFEAHGLEVISAVCKVGGVPKTELGLTGEELLNPAKPEPMCNSILQAQLMNQAKVELNVLLGLCVGHDTLTLRHLEAPATVLAVKDRMLGHNPLAALYCGDTYFSYLKKHI